MGKNSGNGNGSCRSLGGTVATERHHIFWRGVLFDHVMHDKIVYTNYVGLLYFLDLSLQQKLCMKSILALFFKKLTWSCIVFLYTIGIEPVALVAADKALGFF